MEFPGALYAYPPPTQLLTAVLRRIRPTSHPVLLLAPAWPRQSWYSYLMELSIAQAVRLPLDLFPPPKGEFHSPAVQNVQASRVDVVRDGFRGQGFSAHAAGFLSQTLRLSTSLVFDRKWDIFCTWCTQRQIAPVSIPIGDLGDFPLLGPT